MSVKSLRPTRRTFKSPATVLGSSTEEERWRSHPALSALVRVVAWAIPILASVLAAYGSSRILPHPEGTGGLVAWWTAMLVSSTFVLFAVDRLARRLLPLAALLKLSLAFPDRAPDRFWVAFRAGTVRDLHQRLVRARQHGLSDEPADAAAEIITLVGALTTHDRRTRGHCERVRAFNDLLAEEMKLSSHDRDRLRWAALLHDIGKLHTSPAILNKPERPSAEEWEIIRRHPEEGARIIAPLREWLGPWAVTVEQHHERWDGTGYPNGLAAEDIALGARIVAVADAFEVMTAPRPYRKPVNAHVAREELAERACQDFDPVVVRAFLNISLGKLRKIIGPISWLAQLPILGSVPSLPGPVAAAGRQAFTTVGAVTGVAVLSVSSAIQPLLPGTTRSFADELGAPLPSGPDLRRMGASVTTKAGGQGATSASGRSASDLGSPTSVLGLTLWRPPPRDLVHRSIFEAAVPDVQDVTKTNGPPGTTPPPPPPPPPPGPSPDLAAGNPAPRGEPAPRPRPVAPPPRPAPPAARPGGAPIEPPRGLVASPPPPRGRALGLDRATAVGRHAGNRPPRAVRARGAYRSTSARGARR